MMAFAIWGTHPNNAFTTKAEGLALPPRWNLWNGISTLANSVSLGPLLLETIVSQSTWAFVNGAGGSTIPARRNKKSECLPSPLLLKPPPLGTVMPHPQQTPFPIGQPIPPLITLTGAHELMRQKFHGQFLVSHYKRSKFHSCHWKSFKDSYAWKDSYSTLLVCFNVWKDYFMLILTNTLTSCYILMNSEFYISRQ
jgi:hypothetical protein